MSGRFRFFLTPPGEEEREVSMADYVEAERTGGFHNRMGRDDLPATWSWSAMGWSGRTEFVAKVRKRR